MRLVYKPIMSIQNLIELQRQDTDKNNWARDWILASGPGLWFGGIRIKQCNTKTGIHD